MSESSAKIQQIDSGVRKLRYFDCRGLAETTRYMLAIGGMSYEDERFPFSFGTPGDYSTIHKPEFSAAQESGQFVMGMDKVPILITDCAEQIPQSKAIERYVARITGMMGTNDVEAAQIDAVVEHVRDIKLEYQPAASISLEKWYREKLPELSQKLEAALPACVASEKIECPTHESLNYAHVAIYRLYYEFFNDKEGAKEAIEKCPRIQSICASVASHPAVKKWEAERPDTDC